MPQVYAVKFPDGQQLYVFDLTIEDCEAIAIKHNVGWLSIIDHPLQTAGVARDVVTAAAKKLGIAEPALPSVRVLWKMFEVIEDDLPATYEGGLPNSADEPVMAGSSGQ